MDIVTHALMGFIPASPFMMGDHPFPAFCYTLGNVLPDLDSFSRMFGKRAFMKSHQTYTHAVFSIVALGILAYFLFPLVGLIDPWCAPALALGMLVHSFTDFSNTYGIALGLPFTSKRFCREWVFFIDSVVLGSSALVAVYLGWRITHQKDFGWEVQAAYGALLLIYWPIKVFLRHLARKKSPEQTIALIPSALWPWLFYGTARHGNAMQLFQVNLLSGKTAEEAKVALLDEPYLDALKKIPEYNAMCELSPAYHVVKTEPAGNGTRLEVRDLRTRNFKTRFGGLDLVLKNDGQVQDLVFHV